MKISIIQGNEKIPFWRRVTKPSTESCAERNCDDREKLSLQEGSSCKLLYAFQSFFRKITQDKIIITFQVMFYNYHFLGNVHR